MPETSDYKPKHIEGEIPLFETQLQGKPDWVLWGNPDPREHEKIVYAWHVLNCMPAYRLDIQPEDEE